MKGPIFVVGLATFIRHTVWLRLKNLEALLQCIYPIPAFMGFWSVAAL